MDHLNNRFDQLSDASRTGYLIGGFITGTLSIEEREELDAWVAADEKNMELFEDMTEESRVDSFLQWLATRDTEQKLAETKQRLTFKRKTSKRVGIYYAAAAAILLLAGLFIFGPFIRKTEKPLVDESTLTDIQPGSAMAELRLPGNRVIRLQGGSDTMIGASRIRNGQLISGKEEADTSMHEIRIPRKGFYTVVLPDGSKVQLNNESSIRYPASFTGDKREVYVTGETFFEVTKDAARPFIVHTPDMIVQAIGTAFNVNQFDHTVLLTEGVVQVTGAKKKIVLQPGEQVDERWKVTKADSSTAIAWTRNEFRFRDAGIEEIMQVVGRWYDATIIYEDTIDYHFNGTIERSVPVSKLLNLLQQTGHVHFTISGNTITITK